MNQPGTVFHSRCRNNVELVASSVGSGDSPVGFILSGQFFLIDDIPDFSLITADTTLHVDGGELFTRLDELPVFAPEKIDDIMMLFRDCVSAMVEMKTNGDRLRESEAFYRDMFLNMGSSIGVFDENNMFVLVNTQFASLLGYSREELEGKKPWTDFVVKEDLERLEKYHVNRLQSSQTVPAVYEFGMIDCSGIVRRMLNHVVIIPGTTKSVISLVDITDRKNAEEALARSENLYRAIFENTGNATILIENDMMLSLVNSQFVALSGYSKEDLEGRMKWTRFVIPEDLDRMVEFHRLRRVKADSAPWMYEFHFLKRSGEIRDIMVHVVMIPGTGQSVASLLDITERKKAETALRESERRLGDIIDFLPDATFAIDSTGHVTAWNRAIEVMTGVAKKDIIGRGDYEYSIPFYGMRRRILIDLAFEDEEVIMKMYDTVRKEGGLLVAEVFVPCVYKGKGATLWGIVALLHDSSGKVSGAIESIRDISEYRRVEKALRESENTYRAIFENTGSATVMVEEDMIISLANSQWVSLSGYSREEQEGKMKWTSFVVPEDRDFMMEYHRKRRSGKSENQSSVIPWKYEFRFRRRDGEIRQIEVHVVMIPGTMRSIASLVDITDRKRAEEERLEMERRLLHSQKLESLGLLAGGIAHDFNNLLLAVLGNLDISLQRIPDGDPVRSNIEQAMKAGYHAADLTRQMLAYSGKGNFAINRIDVSRLVEENCKMLRVAISRAITLELRLEPDPLPVMADAGQIQQVVLNLITNAAEAIGDGHGEIILATGVSEYSRDELAASRLDVKPDPGLFVWIEVKDNGCGMDDETLQKIFDPFFTTKFTGRGLGMSAVMGVVMAHHGAIMVQSKPGDGTVIRVLLPASPERTGEVFKGKHGERLGSCTGERSFSGTILVVDDEKMVRDMTCEMVELFGFRYMQASEGEEAIRIISGRAEEITCVILDLTMPRMDGLATFNSLREIKSDMPVILSSGFSEQDAMKRFAGKGISGFLQKPYRMEQLRLEIQKVLGGR